MKRQGGAADLRGLVAAIGALVDRVARESEVAPNEAPCSHAETQPASRSLRNHGVTSLLGRQPTGQ